MSWHVGPDNTLKKPKLPVSCPSKARCVHLSRVVSSHVESHSHSVMLNDIFVCTKPHPHSKSYWIVPRAVFLSFPSRFPCMSTHFPFVFLCIAPSSRFISLHFHLIALHSLSLPFHFSSIPFHVPSFIFRSFLHVLLIYA